MSCLKNKKRFLIFSYYGRHVYKIERIGKFIPYVSDDFIVLEKCELCGCEKKSHFVTYEELLNRGISNDDLQKAKSDTY